MIKIVISIGIIFLLYSCGGGKVNKEHSNSLDATQVENNTSSDYVFREVKVGPNNNFDINIVMLYSNYIVTQLQSSGIEQNSGIEYVKMKIIEEQIRYNVYLGVFIIIITMALIFIVYLIRKSRNQHANEVIEKLNSDRPGDENNFTSPANRTFQNVNSIGTKVTWIFNEDASKVQIKGGMFGINTINSTISIESLGYGKFKSSNGRLFTVESNRIKSGHMYINEIYN